MEASMDVGAGLRRIGIGVIMIFAASSCLADDCRFLMRDPLQLRGHQVFFRPKGADGWTALDGVQPDLSSQTVDFAYVIRENIDPARSGVVIVKSARTRRLDEPLVGHAARDVHLVRRAEAFDNGKCGAVADFGEKDISAASYERYHDEGRKVAESGVLHAFHFRYAARRGACHVTDDGTQDSIVPWDARSNRSEFSFDPAVVSGGSYSQALAWFGITPTYASSQKLADQRVELKQYRVDAALPTCVRFRLSALGRGSFLRINDLEDLIANGLNYTRASENAWALSP
ncbi:hypothetical protein [Bradyrhizobium sp.]|uniref:hypothetical protein n=1 Tax=Bradyrhizobium sp. TaxID=376 RepID=UPI003C4FB4BE